MAKKGQSKQLAKAMRDAIHAVAVPPIPQPQAPDAAARVLPENWAIVVVGNIDPRQHHPNWYKVNQFITEDEHRAAMATDKPLIVANQFSQFDAGVFSVTTQAEKWQIQTSKPEIRPRLIEITNRVFERLYEVSVPAFGVNCRLLLDTNAEDVRSILVKKVLEVGLALPANEKASTRIVWKIPTEDYATTIQIDSVSVMPQHLVFSHDRHHPIPESAGLRFDLDKFINRFAMSAWDDAQAFANGVVAEVNRAAEVDRAN